MLKRFLKGLVGLLCVAAIGFVFLLIHLFHEMTPPFDRASEVLPTITIEDGKVIYCRMRSCDFRFPLPENARVVSTNIESGGYDTINGGVGVIGTDGKAIDLRSYAELLQRKRWNVNVVSGADCCTNIPDVPFVSGGKTVHYPLFDEISGSSEHQDGGTFMVRADGEVTKIYVAYFGDY